MKVITNNHRRSLNNGSFKENEWQTNFGWKFLTEARNSTIDYFDKKYPVTLFNDTKIKGWDLEYHDQELGFVVLVKFTDGQEFIVGRTA